VAIWVHVNEEDTADGRVFKPEDGDIPLSRRPRDRFELGPGGTAALMTPGPNDRYIRHPARWAEEDGVVVVRDAGGKVRYRIIEQSADRLLVR
jgi:hypothetical protein